MAALKSFRDDDILEVYKKGFKENFNWNIILPGEMYEYTFLLTLSLARNCPITLAMGSMISLASTIAGPKTRVICEGDYKSPLNIFNMCVSSPGVGKTTFLVI